MYLITIEPIFNNGTGLYSLITDDINVANIFRHQLLKYRNHLLQEKNNDLDQLAGYLFEEIIYKITGKNKSGTHHNGYLLFYDKRNATDFTSLKEVTWEIPKKCTETEKDIIKVQYPNFVYNQFSQKKKHIDKFNILADYFS